jgi:signal transduction histidine kinase
VCRRTTTGLNDDGGIAFPVPLLPREHHVGTGINDADTSELFKAFYTTKSEGLGLGLSICRSIVEAHGGSIEACSNEGPGATFQFTLPVQKI